MEIEAKLLKKLFIDAIEKAKRNNHIRYKGSNKNKELILLAEYLLTRVDLYDQTSDTPLKKHSFRYIWNLYSLRTQDYNEIELQHTSNIDIVCRYVSENSIKNLSDWIRHEANLNNDESTDEISESFFGIYECYFLRPESSDKEEHISKLALIISKPNIVTAKSNVGIYENSSVNKCYYKEKEKILTLRFEGKSNVSGDLHRFQFNLKYSTSRDNKQITFLGIYSGTDPGKGEPVAGKAMLYKTSLTISNNTPDIETIAKEIKVEDYTDTQEIASLFASKPELYTFFSSKNYIHSGEKIKNYLRAVTSKIDLLCGSFSIFSLNSDQLFINQGIMHIDKLGNVKIKGSHGRTYSGYLNVIDKSHLSIFITKYNEGNEQNTPFFMHYLLETTLDKSSSLQMDYFVGVRTILFKNENNAPGAGRVIVQKESINFYESSNFTSYRLRPYAVERDKLTKEFVKKNEKSIFTEPDYARTHKSKTSPKKQVEYLGCGLKSIITSSYDDLNNSNENNEMGLALFHLSLEFASGGDKDAFAKYFQLACLNGFHGDFAEMEIQKAKESRNLDLLKNIKEVSYRKQKFFYLDQKKTKNR